MTLLALLHALGALVATVTAWALYFRRLHGPAIEMLRLSAVFSLLAAGYAAVAGHTDVAVISVVTAGVSLSAVVYLARSRHRHPGGSR